MYSNHNLTNKLYSKNIIYSNKIINYSYMIYYLNIFTKIKS